MSEGDTTSAPALHGEGIQGHVCHHPQFGETLLEGPYGPLAEAFGIPSLGAVQALDGGIHHGEQVQTGHTQAHSLLCHLEQFVDGQALHPGHGRNRRTATTLLDENRIDQVVGAQPVFPHQAAGKIVTTHATHAQGEKLALDVHGGLAFEKELQRIWNFTPAFLS
jgi:hypothetical protein